MMTTLITETTTSFLKMNLSYRWLCGSDEHAIVFIMHGGTVEKFFGMHFCGRLLERRQCDTEKRGKRLQRSTEREKRLRCEMQDENR